MWAIVLILVIFLTIWMSLTFTDTLCDNKYVGMGLCYNAAWKTQRPVSFCPPCAQSPARAPVALPQGSSGYTADPFASY
jgi:hypothetical protein